MRWDLLIVFQPSLQQPAPLVIRRGRFCVDAVGEGDADEAEGEFAFGVADGPEGIGRARSVLRAISEMVLFLHFRNIRF